MQIKINHWTELINFIYLWKIMNLIINYNNRIVLTQVRHCELGSAKARRRFLSGVNPEKIILKKS
jgi:hypothetical protein